MRLRGTRDPGSGERVPVELEEADGSGARAPDTPGAGAPGSPGDPAAPRRRRPATWWVGAAVLVALVVVVAVANVVEARREADRRAALAELTWVLPAIDGPLQEVWRAPGTGVTAVTSDVVVLQDVAGGLRGVDPATGAELWALDFAASGYCGPTSGSWPYDLEPGDATDALLLCQSPNEVGVDTGTWQTLEIRTVDARTGEALADLSVDGTLVAAALADDDLVLVTTRPGDTVVVDRTDLRTGERLWRYEGEPGSGSRYLPSTTDLGVTDTAVVVTGTRDLALSAETGALLPDDQGRPSGRAPDLRLDLHDGGVVEWSSDRTGGISGTGRVVDADGSVRFTFEGNPQQPYAYDRAETALVVRRWSADGSTGTTTALDIGTGETLWSEPTARWTTELLGLDGHVLMMSGVARMLDERTGHEVWQASVDLSVAMYAPVSDGDVVVLPVRDDVGQLAAVELGNGAERWRMPAPDGLTALGAAPGLVLAITDSEVIAYRP